MQQCSYDRCWPGKSGKENVYVNNEKRHKNGYEKMIATIGHKIVETLYSNRVTSENKRIHTPPMSLHSKLECLLFSIGRLNSGTTLHRGDGEEKLYFHILKSVKRKKGQFRAKCLNLFCRRL